MKIRILEVLASLRRAGAERMVVSLACGLDRSRFDIEVVSLYDAVPEGFEAALEEAGVRVQHLGKHQGLDVRMIPRLNRVMRAFKPAIVHTHSYVLRYALPAGWAAGRPRIVHTVHNVARKEVDGIGRMIHRIAYGTGTAAVAVSGEVARSFREFYGRDPEAVIPNGVDLEPFACAGGGWRAANGFSEEDGLIVSVARLEPQKNPLRLIEAFAGALKSDTRWHLLLAGDGSLMGTAEQHAARLGIGERVHLLGVRSDIPSLLAACDFFAMAADWEGSPLAVIEAMASGLPVVATAVGGVPELVEDGASGVLAEAGDIAALTEAIVTMARDSRRRKEFGCRARERAGRFSARSMIASYAELFERIAGGAK